MNRILAGRRAGRVGRVGRAGLAAAASVVAALAAIPSLCFAADDIDRLQLLSQRDFRLLSEDLGSALSFKSMIPAEPLGVTGFDVGVTVTGVRLKHRDIFERASSGSDIPSAVPLASVRVHKGLPFGIDIGAAYSTLPGTEIGVIGGEVRWAFIEGGVALPAVAVRGTATKLIGVDQLDLETTSLDVSISKGILNVTPYGGVGRVWTTSTPDGVPGLAKESFSQNKVFAGVNVFLGFNLAFEVDRTGDVTSYGVKGGFRF
jgi:hypothetical protein